MNEVWGPCGAGIPDHLAIFFNSPRARHWAARSDRFAVHAEASANRAGRKIAPARLILASLLQHSIAGSAKGDVHVRRSR